MKYAMTIWKISQWLNILYWKIRIDRYYAPWCIESIDTSHIKAMKFAYSYNGFDLINTPFNSFILGITDINHEN